MMSLAAPPPPPQQQAGMLPPGAPGFPAGTGLGGGYPPPYGVGGPGFPGGAYQGGVPGSYPASTAPPMSSGNPVQARLTARASATHKAPHADMQTCSSQDMETFQRMNALDAEALRRIFRKFQEVDQVSLLEVVALPTCRTSRLVPQERTGMVDVNEFCRLLRVERSPFVERLFSMFDTDRGGLIDLKEFIVGACARLCCAVNVAGVRGGALTPANAGLANVSGDVREDKVRFAFEIFDLDNSGFIEVHELRKIVRATNLASEKQLDRKVRWLLSQCDIDGDGQIRCTRSVRSCANAAPY